MTKVFKLITDILFIIVIVILFGYFVLRITNKVEIYNVKTGSMEEKIHVGDYILIFRKSNYEVGDVVTYTSNNGFITHRIIKKEGNKVTTKGDANNTEDETINASIILGKVILSGGFLNIIINYKYTIVGLLLSLYLFSSYFAGKKEEEEKLETENNMLDEVKDDILIEEDINSETNNNDIVENKEVNDNIDEEKIDIEDKKDLVSETVEKEVLIDEENSTGKENTELNNTPELTDNTIDNNVDEDQKMGDTEELPVKKGKKNKQKRK